MLQHTFEALEREFQDNNDACIDAAKSIVECACRIIIENLDDPASPLKPESKNPDFGEWLSATVRVLELSEIRDNAFQKLISQYNKLSTTLGDLRNLGGNVSHGKDGFIRKLSDHHRRAALLAADAIVTFLHEAYLETEPDPTLSLEPYERYRGSNDLIDRFVGCRLEEDEEGGLTATFTLPDRQELPLAVNPSQLLFHIDREAYKLAQNACREVNVDDLQDEETG
jgi:hypothetical protein